MEHLWAPWRIEYLTGPRSKSCVFCDYPSQDEGKDRENLILLRAQYHFVILNRYPYSNAHLMVVPYQHTCNLSDLNHDASAEMLALSARMSELLKKTVYAQGINLGMNLGEAAGAGIKEHLHLHLVPRWIGDTNFMPILSGERVMVEYLLDSYDRLKGGL